MKCADSPMYGWMTGNISTQSVTTWLGFHGLGNWFQLPKTKKGDTQPRNLVKTKGAVLARSKWISNAFIS
jgi:hypothetical protein